MLFDKVDEYVFRNRKFAVNEDGKPHYDPEKWFSDDGGKFVLHLGELSREILSIVIRCLGVIPNSHEAGNWIKDPEVIKFHRAKSTFYLQTKTGKLLVEKRIISKPLKAAA
jgi:hypothetical protein